MLKKTNDNIVIGIEGYVGSGKTSICKELLKRIPNSILFHGGDFYRAIVFSARKYGYENLENADIYETMKDLNVEIKIENGETVYYSRGEKITEEELQCKETSMGVSKVSNTADNRAFFKYTGELVNEFKEKYNVILSGRALMVIYPECDYHIMVKASLDERTRRKAMQYGIKEGTKEFSDLRDHIDKRDKLQEDSGFYKLYPITKVVDVTDCKSVQESTELLLNKL